VRNSKFEVNQAKNNEKNLEPDIPESSSPVEEEKRLGAVEILSHSENNNELNDNSLLEKVINSEFSRKITEGKFLGFTAIWLTKRMDGTYKFYYEGKHEIYCSRIKESSIPKSIFWIKDIADCGIRLNGRGYSEKDYAQAKLLKYGLDCDYYQIADIIASHKLQNGMPEIFLVRYLGESMGNAQ